MSAGDHLSPRQFPIVEHAIDGRVDGPGWRKLVAYHPGAPADDENDMETHQVGLVSFKDEGSHIALGNRRTHEDYRHRGVATALQDALERRAGNKDLISDPEEFSDDAHDFREAYVAKRPSSRWKVGKS